MDKKHGFILLMLFLFGLILPSCAKKKLPSDKNLYQQGLKKYEKKSYNKAIEDFQTLEDNYPESPYVPEARLKKADS